LFDLIPEEQLEAEFKNLIKELMLEHLKERRTKLADDILRAEEDGKDGRVLELLKEFDDVLRKMQDIENAGAKEEVRS